MRKLVELKELKGIIANGRYLLTIEDYDREGEKEAYQMNGVEVFEFLTEGWLSDEPELTEGLTDKERFEKLNNMFKVHRDWRDEVISIIKL